MLLSRQLGHSNIATTMAYLRSISNLEVIDAVTERAAPMVPVSVLLAA